MSGHPKPTEQEAGWEPELAWALWSKEKSLSLQESKYDASGVKPVAYSIYQLCYLSSV